MNTKRHILITIFLLIITVLYIWFIYGAPDPSIRNNATISNPASSYCTNSGGTLSIEKDGSGGEYNLCHFEDSRSCEEWAMFRGDCPIGGIKTTGYNTIDQKFCAWSGGSTYAVEHSMCTFKNGTSCSTLDLYNRTCLSS